MNRVNRVVLLGVMVFFINSCAMKPRVEASVDTIELLSGIFDFGMDSFQGKPGAEADARLVKTWDFAMDRVRKYMDTAFNSSDLPVLAGRVDALGKEIFKFEVYKSKLKPRDQKFVEYKDDIYNANQLLSKLGQLETKKNTLKKDIDKKLGFKDKAKLLFSSKTTKAIKNDEQEARTFLLTIVDLLNGVLVKIKEIIKSEKDPNDKESKRRRG